MILVHHNYAGLNQFDVDQACFLAKSGYVGLAVDLYKETPLYTYKDRQVSEGKPVDFEGFSKALREEDLLNKGEYPEEEVQGYWGASPKDEDGKVHWQGTRSFVGAFGQMQQLLSAPETWRSLMRLYLEAAFKHSAVKAGCAGGIGYCLGGQSCLEQLRSGQQVQAICSFHGLLHSRPMHPEDALNSQSRITKEEYESKFALTNTYTKDCRVLIENGANDEEVPKAQIDEWIEEMDAQEIDWRFENHARGPHGFSLARGTPGGYHFNEKIDRRACIAMFSLFAETWPGVKQYAVECNACGTHLGQLIAHTSP